MRRSASALLALLGGALAFGGALPSCGEDGPVLDVSSDVERCRENLRAIHTGLVALTERSGRPPQGSGVALLAEPFAAGVWPQDAAHRALLACPGPYAQPIPPGVDYTRVDRLGPECTSYAGRDTVRFPFDAYPLGGRDPQPVAACDGAPGRANHDGMVNVLYADGSVRTHVIAELVARGVVPTGTRSLGIGPDALLEDLRMLRED